MTARLCFTLACEHSKLNGTCWIKPLLPSCFKLAMSACVGCTVPPILFHQTAKYTYRCQRCERRMEQDKTRGVVHVSSVG